MGILSILLRKQKSRLAPRFLKSGAIRSLVFGLYQGADAFGTQNLAVLAPVLEDAYGLQVWPKRPGGRFLRPGTVAAKRSCFTTMCTLRHNNTSLL